VIFWGAGAVFSLLLCIGLGFGLGNGVCWLGICEGEDVLDLVFRVFTTL